MRDGHCEGELQGDRLAAIQISTPNAALSRVLSVRVRRIVTMLCLAAAGLASQACCGSAWTTRVCTSNASGNCKAISNAQPHRYTLKSTSVAPVLHGLSDVSVREPACDNGIGEVDVKVVDRDDLEVTVFCLVDASGGGMTLTPAATSPVVVPSSSTDPASPRPSPLSH